MHGKAVKLNVSYYAKSSVYGSRKFKGLITSGYREDNADFRFKRFIVSQLTFLQASKDNVSVAEGTLIKDLGNTNS
jgi:hypothetical protein